MNHTTEQCKEFKKLPVSGKKGRYELIKQVNTCFKCFGNHRKQNCLNKETRSASGSNQHHTHLCKPQKDDVESPSKNKTKETVSHVTGSDSLALHPIHQVSVSGSGRKVFVFCDEGSNASYITHDAVERIKAKKIQKLSLDMMTMGNAQKTYTTIIIYYLKLFIHGSLCRNVIIKKRTTIN